MQRKGTAGKKIIGTVSERLNESIDSQIKVAKLKKMVKALLECEKMKSAKEFLNSISLTECKAKDLAKLLLKYPDFEVKVLTVETNEWADSLEYVQWDIPGIADIGYSDKVIVYFADSYCSWQKGAIENANKLIRKYIPKKANFNNFSDRKIMEIQKKLN